MSISTFIEEEQPTTEPRRVGFVSGQSVPTIGDIILLDGVRYVVKHREWDCSDHRIVAATVVVRRT